MNECEKYGKFSWILDKTWLFSILSQVRICSPSIATLMVPSWTAASDWHHHSIANPPAQPWLSLMTTSYLRAPQTLEWQVRTGIDMCVLYLGAKTSVSSLWKVPPNIIQNIQNMFSPWSRCFILVLLRKIVKVILWPWFSKENWIEHCSLCGDFNFDVISLKSLSHSEIQIGRTNFT